MENGGWESKRGDPGEPRKYFIKAFALIVSSRKDKKTLSRKEPITSKY
jgi:hypothetical protein